MTNFLPRKCGNLPASQSEVNEESDRRSLRTSFSKSRLTHASLKMSPCQAAIWLFRALHSALLSTSSDFRMAMETSLEWASIPDISRAILFVLGIDIEIPVEKGACKMEYLRNCIHHCLETAANFEAK